MNKLIYNANKSKTKLNPIIMSLLFLLYYLASLVLASLVYGVLYGILSSLPNLDGNILEQNLFVQFYSFITMILFSAIWVKLIEKRPSLNIKLNILLKQYLYGAVGGIVAVSIPSVLMIIFASAKNVEIDLSLATLSGVLIYLIFFMIQGAAEEVLCRWALMIPLGRKIGIIGSVFVTSLFFTALHFNNPGMGLVPIINLFLAGIVFGIMFYYHESPWPAFAAHSFWNFTMGNIFGILVSGQELGPSILKPYIAGPSLISGGGFGVEGTIFTTIIGIFIFVVYLYLYKKKFGTFSVKENYIKENVEDN